MYQCYPNNLQSTKTFKVILILLIKRLKQQKFLITLAAHGASIKKFLKLVS